MDLSFGFKLWVYLFGLGFGSRSSVLGHVTETSMH